jgi:hypothetical protein
MRGSGGVDIDQAQGELSAVLIWDVRCRLNWPVRSERFHLSPASS